MNTYEVRAAGIVVTDIKAKDTISAMTKGLRCVASALRKQYPHMNLGKMNFTVSVKMTKPGG